MNKNYYRHFNYPVFFYFGKIISDDIVPRVFELLTCKL